MRENSGKGEGHNNDGDPTLRERAGKGGPGEAGGDFTDGASFEVAADHDPAGGKRSPSARGRGEAASTDDVLPSDTPDR